MTKKELNDACFSLLYYPEKNDYLKEFIVGSIEIIEKKYNITDPVIKRIFHLLKTVPDNDARLFAFCFIIYWENTIANALEETYAKEDRPHFRKYVNRMNVFINKTTNFSYDKHNIIEMITEFVKASKLEWTMGPFE